MAFEVVADSEEACDRYGEAASNHVKGLQTVWLWGSPISVQERAPPACSG
jgi:hypothetical protein